MCLERKSAHETREKDEGKEEEIQTTATSTTLSKTRLPLQKSRNMHEAQDEHDAVRYARRKDIAAR